MKQALMLLRPVLLAILCLLFLPACAGEAQAFMVELSRKDLTHGADSIVVGTVTGVSSRWNEHKNNIYTEVVIAVEENLKASENRTAVTVLVPGGKVGDIRQWVEDTPSFRKGERVGLFLKELKPAGLSRAGLGGMPQLTATQMMTVYGEYQGKLTFVEDEHGLVIGTCPNTFKRDVALVMAGLSPDSFRRLVNLEIAGLSLGKFIREVLPAAERPAHGEPVVISEITHNQVIDNISPGAASAGTGTRVTVSGSGFGTRGENDQLLFYYTTWGDLAYFMDSPIVSWTDTEIVARVPLKEMAEPYHYFFAAASGPVSVYKDDSWSEYFPRITTFGYEQKRWPGDNPTVTYRVNAGGDPDRLAAVQAAADSWSSAGANFRFHYEGATAAAFTGFNSVNEVLWMDLPDYMPGRATIWWDQYGNILECDFAFNTKYIWSAASFCPPGQFDVQTVAVHEFGHWLLLTDLYGNYPGYPQDTEKVMYGYIGQGITRRTLHAHDVLGIRWIYGSAGDACGVSTPNRPAGPDIGLTDTEYTFSTGGAGCSSGHVVQYRFDWGDGTYSSWGFSTSAANVWDSPGTYLVRAQARCFSDATVVSSWSVGRAVTVSPDSAATCSISVPNRPAGPDSGLQDVEYTFFTGGAGCSAGHAVEYRFDWGDGVYSSWGFSTSAANVWSSPGAYLVRAQARCFFDTTAVSSWSVGQAVTVSPGPLPGTVERIFGASRYETAVEVSRAGWPGGAGTVLLARGDNFPDSLAGVSLAHQLCAPILLTPTNWLHEATREEIDRLGAARVIILGGRGAVSETVADALEDGLGLDVERIGGRDRFETAALIAARLAEEQDYSLPLVYIANGYSFPDALAAATYGARHGIPILISRQDSLTESTSGFIEQHSAIIAFIAGGTNVVGEAVNIELAELGIENLRFSGSDRYETAVKLAEEFLPVKTRHIYIATGVDFPDALAGAVLAAKSDSGLLLVRGDLAEPNPVVQEFVRARGITAVTIFGGAAAVSSGIAEWFQLEQLATGLYLQ